MYKIYFKYQSKDKKNIYRGSYIFIDTSRVKKVKIFSKNKKYHTQSKNIDV